MKKKALVIGGLAVTAALVGGWALAQTIGTGPSFMHGQGAGGMGMGHGMMNGNGMMKGMGPGMMHGAPGRGLADAEHIDELKVELGITPAQEQAWSKYAKAVQDAAAAMKASREGVDPQAFSKMNPADRFAFVTKMREQGQKQFETVKAAANELLTALDDKQKAEAVDLLPGLAEFGPGMMLGAGMGGPQHRH